MRGHVGAEQQAGLTVARVGRIVGDGAPGLQGLDQAPRGRLGQLGQTGTQLGQLGLDRHQALANRVIGGEVRRLLGYRHPNSLAG